MKPGALHGLVGTKAEAAAVALFFAVLFQAIGALLGQDAGWDQANYHLSSVHAWLHGRPWADFAVSQQQSWFNPAAELPAWLIVTHLPARPATMALALLPLGNAMALWALVRRFVFPGPGLRAAILGLACTFVGVVGTVHLVVVATTMAEAWTPALVLCAFYALLAALDAPPPAQVRRLAIAGLLLGFVAGLKPTNAPFVIGAVLTLALFRSRLAAGLAPLLAFAAGGTAGFAVGGGWWMVALWREYGDPAFPMFSKGDNAWIGADAVSHQYFLRQHWWQLFTDPFRLAVGDHSTQLSTVMPVRDARYLVGFYAALVVLTNALRLRITGHWPDRPVPEVAAALFATCYVTWVAAFNVDRYVLPLELFAPAMAALMLQRLGLLESRRAALAFFAFLALIVVASRPVRTMREPITADWFGLSVPPGIAGPDTLYVMTGWEALGWLTLYDVRLGPRAAFVRISGNLRIDPDRALGARITAAVRTHRGPLRSLTDAKDMPQMAADLARFGLAAMPGTCLAMVSKRGPIVSCRITRLTR